MWWWAAFAWAGPDEVLGDLERYRVNAAYPETELQVAARTRAAVEKLKITPATRDAEAAWRVTRNGGDPRSIARWLSAVSNRDPSPAVRRDAAARAARLAPIAEKLALEAPRFEEARRLVGLHRYAAARERLDPLRALVPEDPEIDWWIGESWLGEALGADATVDMDTPSPALLGWSIAIPSYEPGLAPERALALADDAFGRAAHGAPGWIRARISGFEVRVAMARRDAGRLPELVPPARAIEANAERWPLDDRRDAARVLGLYRQFGGGAPADRAARALASFDEAAALGDPISAWNAAVLRAGTDPDGWAQARATTGLVPGAPTWWVGPGGDLGKIASTLDDGYSAFTLGSGPSVLVVDGEAYIWTVETPAKPAAIAMIPREFAAGADVPVTTAAEPMAVEEDLADAEIDTPGKVESKRALQEIQTVSASKPRSKPKHRPTGARSEAKPEPALMPPRPSTITLSTPYRPDALLGPSADTISVTRRDVCDRAHCTSIVVVSPASE